MECPSFLIGELVWGKLQARNPWWPAKIVPQEEVKQKGVVVQPNQRWVLWFGDFRNSLVSTHYMRQFKTFNGSMNRVAYQRRSLYKTAIHQALEFAVSRAKVEINPMPICPLSSIALKTRYEELMCWAKNDFPPDGPDSLMPSTEETMATDGADEASSAGDSRRQREFVKKMKRIKEIRKIRVKEVKKRKKELKDFCLVCGDESVVTGHPLFEGGLCEDCRKDFLKSAFVYDEDGSRSLCSVCSEGKTTLICDKHGCDNIFCTCCLDVLVGPGTSQKELQNEEDPWICYLCRPKDVHGLLKRRKDWRQRLHQMMKGDVDSARFPNNFVYQLVPVKERKRLRVLSLNDNIGAGRVVLKNLGFDIAYYYASEDDKTKMQAVNIASIQHSEFITHVPEIRLITFEDLEKWQPIDLLIGNCPVGDILEGDHSKRAVPAYSYGLHPTVARAMDFFRICDQLAKTRDPNRPFFWLFEAESDISVRDSNTISNFLKDEPLEFDAKFVSAIDRKRLFWGNLPGMHRPGFTKMDFSKKTLQDCLQPYVAREAKMEKIDIIRFKNIQTQTDLPVINHKNEDDELWITEIERLVGLPAHYTDVCCGKVRDKIQFVCESWSAPILQHLLSPLKEYYASAKPELA